MPKFGYAMQAGERSARAHTRTARVSRKFCVELGRAVSGRPLEDARRILTDVISLRRPVKFRTFVDGLAHQRGGLGPGRYPVKAARAMLEIIESAAKNAEAKGLDEKKLVVRHISATKGPTIFRPRLRWRPQQMKSTHLAVILEERAEKKEEAKEEAKSAKKKSKK